MRSIVVVKLFRTRVFEDLQRTFSDAPNVEVILDRRGAERRRRRETVVVERRWRPDRRTVNPRWNELGYFITRADAG